jgi:hypothetical protein
MVKFSVHRFLSEIEPQAMCVDCIRDRAPISERRMVQVLINNLGATEFVRTQGECCACYRAASVIRRTSPRPPAPVGKVED